MTMTTRGPRPVRFFLLLIFVLGVFGSRTLWAGTPSKAYFEALRALKREDFADGVKRYYKFIVLENPFLTPACCRQDLRTARIYFIPYLKSERRAKARLFLCLIERIAQAWPTANRQVDEFLREAPTSALVHFLKGEFLFAQTKPTQGREFFRKLKSLGRGAAFIPLAEHVMQRTGLNKPSDPRERVETRLAAAFRSWDLMAFEEAARQFEAILTDHPDEKGAYRGWCEMLLERKDFAGARKIFDRWAGRSTEPLLPPLTEGRFWYTQRDFRQATALLEPLARGSGPEAEYSRTLLAECLFQTEAFDQALPLFRELQARDRINSGLVQRLATCLECLGRGEEAVSTYQEYLRFNSEETLTRLEAAALLVRLGKYAPARVIYLEIAAKGGEQGEYAVARAEEISSLIPPDPIPVGRKSPPPAKTLGTPVQGSGRLAENAVVRKVHE